MMLRALRLMRPLVTATLGFALAIASRSAHADDDYDPASREWNGLASLVEIADRAGVPLEVVDELDIGTLGPNDALLIVYPTRDLPVAGLSELMRAGGRVAIADDFGEGGPLLEVYGIERVAGAPPDAPHLQANEALPVARAVSGHALADGVAALVTNHPATLRHPALEPLFAFDDGSGDEAPERALVLAGAVGEGRLVAISDPSILINNMLELRDNRRFAENLVRYLDAGTGGRVILARGEAELTGVYGEPGAGGPFHALTSWLTRIAHADAPGAAVLVFAIVIAAILIVIAMGALPRRSPYEGSAMFARPPASGGFIGRVGFFRRHPDDLLPPALVYKYELEGELVRLLGLGGRPLLRDVVMALRERGLREADVALARALLVELDDLRRRQDLPPSPPRVAARRFRQMVATGEHLLGRLHEAASTYYGGQR
jgi:hypothetical protein